MLRCRFFLRGIADFIDTFHLPDRGGAGLVALDLQPVEEGVRALILGGTATSTQSGAAGTGQT
jgi:hypothetical protein